MSSEWHETTLGDFADINPKRPIAKNSVTPFIEMAALPTFSRDVSIADVIERPFTGGGAKFTNGDTLLARITPCLENGKTALVSCLPPSTNGYGSTEFIVLAPRSIRDKNFLYYLTRSDEFRAYAISRMEGTSGRQRVPNNAVAQFSFLCPPEQDRKLIGDFLASLDNKIALLRETNATLEAIAQALFKSWFVDFDPVHANAKGRAPEASVTSVGRVSDSVTRQRTDELSGYAQTRANPTYENGGTALSETAAALFPDGFEESELGLVPRGWKHSTVEQSFILTMGQSPPGDTYNSLAEGLPFYQGRTDFGLRFPTKRIFCNAPTRTAEVGDTLVSVRAPVGDVNMAIERCCLGRGVASVRHPLNYRSFAFYTIKGLRSKFDMYDSEGTVFGSINKKDFQALLVIEPTKEVLKAFDDIAAPLDDRIIANEEVMRTLATLRDTLLPRLISGQLRLPQAEAVLA